MNDPTMPIAAEWRPEVGPVAEAGYRAYVGDRPHLPWNRLLGHQTFRWMLVAQAMLAEEGTQDPAAVRDVYLQMYYAGPWSGLSARDKARWTAVRDAMVMVRDVVRDVVRGAGEEVRSA